MVCKYVFSLIIVLAVVSVESQVCVKLAWYRVEYNITYLETLTNGSTTIKTKTLLDVVKKPMKYCCAGYTEVNDYTSTDAEDIKCEPMCDPVCGPHGYCAAPGVCNCSAGYERRNPIYRCSPRCEPDCGFGNCVAPNQCECFHFYKLINGTCQAVCSEPCYNGTCSSGHCVCPYGYRKSVDHFCKPYCAFQCDNGFCVKPETCQCNPGFRLEKNDVYEMLGYSYSGVPKHVCRPDCQISCGNGTCVSPNVCQCFRGYEIDTKQLNRAVSDGPLCVPSCKSCSGDCVAPNTCIATTPPTGSQKQITWVYPRIYPIALPPSTAIPKWTISPQSTTLQDTTSQSSMDNFI